MTRHITDVGLDILDGQPVDGLHAPTLVLPLALPPVVRLLTPDSRPGSTSTPPAGSHVRTDAVRSGRAARRRMPPMRRRVRRLAGWALIAWMAACGVAVTVWLGTAVVGVALLHT